ncbi:DUF2333 family protein [Methylophaga lonarensis]|uniref:DUF2333 family protein n=1 Tax=Methylophaga lonarensis TaxID=999151 RepID=UPI003D2E2785
MQISQSLQTFKFRAQQLFNKIRLPADPKSLAKPLAAAGLTFLLLILLFMWWWSRIPSLFDPAMIAQTQADTYQHEMVPGYVSTVTLKQLGETLLNKSGGYLRNDVLPPSVWMDNMPSWEFGVLTQIRDFTSAMQQDFSRSLPQFEDDPDLKQAAERFAFDSNSWMFPSSEREYRRAIRSLASYQSRLGTQDEDVASFTITTQALDSWLNTVTERLQDRLEKLSASHRPLQKAINQEHTPRYQIDNVFFETRGQLWALKHLLEAVQVDFAEVLSSNANELLSQMVMELEVSLRSLCSPIILNRHGFGLLANHSLTLAFFVQRLQTDLALLRQELAQ